MQDKEHRENRKNTKYFPHAQLTYNILSSVFEVRNIYGSGQKELVYQNALAEALDKRNIKYQREVSIKIISLESSKTLGSYKLDFLIDKKVILEVKSLKFTPSKIEQQLYSYLKSTEYEVGFLVNFGSTNLFYKRVILTNDRKHKISVSV